MNELLDKAISIAVDSHSGQVNDKSEPYVLHPLRMMFKAVTIEEKIIALSKYLNLKETSFDGFMKWILDLREKLLIPHTLKELINDNSKFEQMSVMAKDDPSTGGNPIKLESADFLDLYINSYNGNL